MIVGDVVVIITIGCDACISTKKRDRLVECLWLEMVLSAEEEDEVDDIAESKLLFAEAISVRECVQHLVREERILLAAQLHHGGEGRRAVAEFARLWLGEAVEGEAGRREGAEKREHDAGLGLLPDVLEEVAALRCRGCVLVDDDGRVSCSLRILAVAARPRLQLLIPCQVVVTFGLNEKIVGKPRDWGKESVKKLVALLLLLVLLQFAISGFLRLLSLPRL